MLAGKPALTMEILIILLERHIELQYVSQG